MGEEQQLLSIRCPDIKPGVPGEDVLNVVQHQYSNLSAFD
jgi:hypothetical protein